MKLECLDPLNSTFLEFRVATCLEVLNDGYLKIGFDGEEIEEETIALHSISANLFPVGYAKKFNIILRSPEDDEQFSWEDYLKENQATAADPSLFNPIPSPETMQIFTVRVFPGKLSLSNLVSDWRQIRGSGFV